MPKTGRTSILVVQFTGSPKLPSIRRSTIYTHWIGLCWTLYTRPDGNQDKENAKCYVCLFTCASTRAVHLELLRSLTVESFLLAFRRFASRRGLPAILISDNAKTFKRSSKEVQKIARSKEVMRYLSNNGVSWKFIVEKAPWWGGFWERLIQSVKRCLKKCIGRTTLNYDELQTLLSEVETVVNSRALTYVEDDHDLRCRTFISCCLFCYVCSPDVKQPRGVSRKFCCRVSINIPEH